MTERVERYIAGFFLSYGQESCRNVRAMLTGMRPWDSDELGFRETIANDQISSNVAKQLQAVSTLTSRYPTAGPRALATAGLPPAQIGALGRAAARLRSATRGLGSLGTVYDRFMTREAFAFAEGQLIGRHEYILTQRAEREGFEGVAAFVPKVRSFFETIDEFLLLVSLSILEMPPPEVNQDAIQAAFDMHGIPDHGAFDKMFSEPDVPALPSPATEVPASTTAPAPGSNFLNELNDTFWDGIDGLENGRSPF